MSTEVRASSKIIHNYEYEPVVLYIVNIICQ